MKKIVALLLALASVCALSAAAAQSVEVYRENASFYVEVTLPSGARIADTPSEGQTVIEYAVSGKPTVIITTAADELYTGQSLADLSKENLDLIVSGITVEMADPVTDIRKTADGREYIVANESTAENDTCDTVTLLNGYFIMIHVFYPDMRELTPEDMQIGPAIMETLRFVGNTNS